MPATQALLQGDDDLLASYCPLAAGLRQAVSQLQGPFCERFLVEFTNAERRNMSKQFTGPVGRNWGSCLELARVCSLVHPLYRRGTHLGDDLGRISRKCWTFCLQSYMHTHQITDSGILVGDNEVPQQEYRPPRRRLKGMADLQAGLTHVLGTPVPVDMPAEPTVRRTLQEAVLDSGRVFMGAELLRDNPLVWWGTTGKKDFKYLYPGAMALLQHRAGNGPEERLAGFLFFY